MTADMKPLFEAIVRHCPPPDPISMVRCNCRFSQLDYSNYVGRHRIGVSKRGRIKRTAMSWSSTAKQGAQRAPSSK